MRHILILMAGATVLCSFSLDEPIIMERIVHRVEWEEILFEYDSSVAPIRNMTVEVNASLVSYQFDNHPKIQCFAIYDTVISWADQRLRIPIGVKVSVPDTVKIWKPKVIVHNAISDQILLSALSYSNGKLNFHQRHHMQLSYEKKPEIEPMFSAFEDGSFDSIAVTINIDGKIPANTSSEGWLSA